MGSYVKKGRAKTLSPEHRANIAAAGRKRKHSVETRKKMSTLAKARGKDFYEQTSLSLTGRKFTKEHKEKLSAAKKGKYTLANNPNWRGGLSFVPYPLGWSKTFKEQIRYRDGYICQVCGMPEVENGKRLDVHHKDYDKNNLTEKNLVSLCVRCHRKTNHNRKYWQQFFG